MLYNKAPLYKQIPFIRILLPFVTGVLLQYHLSLSIVICLYALLISTLLVVVVFFLPVKYRFKWSWLGGAMMCAVLMSVGGINSYVQNIEHHPYWLGKVYANKDAVKLTLQEPIQVKQGSYKALATANAIFKNNQWLAVKGDVLLYFKKDSSIPSLQYGSQIVLLKPLTRIINAGNPGGFNYARYCSFEDIHYQAFLQDDDFITLNTQKKSALSSFLLHTRDKILTTIRTYIAEKNITSVAEALLIGYRADLDRDLVQAYSNTGVVHIIAISGLHLGMIYVLLIKLLSLFGKPKWMVVAKPIVVLSILWLFSLLAGAAPSILRSAVMFSCIIVGETFNRKTNIYNSLAVSAFILLLINPFTLWDVGFQLSYSAVLSIIIFQPYINKWFYSKYKLLQQLWSLVAVSLAAQILTLPIVVYHFHQFPLLFLITNLFAVPLSGIILYALLFLLCIGWLPVLATWVGLLIAYAIKLLNASILYFNQFSWVVWPSIQITIVQACVLYTVIISLAIWLMQRKKIALTASLLFALTFCVLRTVDFVQKNHQQKLIVYNVPKHTAIDLIEGRNYSFIGDSVLVRDGFLRNFHIKPSRILHRITPTKNILKSFSVKDNIVYCKGKKIIIIDEAFEIPSTVSQKIDVDVIILTKNPKIYLNKLYTLFNCKQYVFDSSNPFWKVNYWKKDADSLHLPHHSTATQGAFIMDL